MSRTHVSFPDELHTALKVQAAKEGKSMQDLLGQLVREYLKTVEEKGRSAREAKN